MLKHRLPVQILGVMLAVLLVGACGDAKISAFVAVPAPFPSGNLYLGCPDFDGERPLPELSNGETVEAGANHGTFSVSSAGEANFLYGIEAVPGRAGQVPGISVRYSSGADEGYLGFGFALGGLSAISRCGKNLADDGEIEAVGDDAGDAFCMDGARLVEVAPNEYRTVPDSFSRIVASSNANGPEAFTVYAKSGLIFEYGSEDSGKVFAKDGVVRSWLISKQRDRNENAVLYSYKNERDAVDGHTLEFAPERIDYTDHPDSPASRALVFKYESQTPRELYARGMLLKRSLKLKTIEARGPENKLVREYRFAYKNSPNTQRMLLSSIQECALDQACKPSTKFSYHHGQGTGFEELITGISGPNNDVGSLMTLDMTGDGLDDLLISEWDDQLEPGEDKTLWRLLPNQGQGNYLNASQVIFEQSHLIDPLTNLPGPPESATPIDFDHNGRMDLLLHDLRGEYAHWGVLISSGTQPAQYLKSNTKRIYAQGSAPPLYFNSATASSHLADINGDGMPDLVSCVFENVHEWSVQLWTPQGFDANAIPIATLLQHPCDIEFIPGDIDADGQNEVLVPGSYAVNGGIQLTAGFDLLAFKHQGNIWTREDAGLPRVLSGGRMILLDMNGDGLLDALQSGFQDAQLRLFINTGDGFLNAANAIQNVIPELDQFFGLAAQIDWNSDGRSDLLLPIQSGLPKPEWKILQSNGKTFDIIDAGIPFEALLTSAGVTAASPLGPRVTDVNGDGLQDLILVIAKQIRIYKNQLHGEEDRLKTITDGFNPWEESDPAFIPTVSIEYDHLMDRSITDGPGSNIAAASRIYLSKNGSAPEECAYPLHCVVGSKRVVSHYSIYQGGTKAHHFEVAYRNARHHRLGRGFLGFQNKILRDVDTGAGESLFFDNTSYNAAYKTFPYAGRPIRELRWNPSPYADPVTELFPIEMAFVSRWLDLIPKGDTYFVLNTFQGERREQGFILNNSLLASEFYARNAESNAADIMAQSFRYVLDFDDFGNILKERVTTADQSERTLVTREVENNTQDWLIGLLKKESKCSESNGIEQCRFFEREYDSAGKLQSEYSADGNQSQSTQLFLTIERDKFGNVIETITKDGFGNVRPSCIRYEPEGIFPWATSNGENLIQYYRYDPGLGVLKTYEDPKGLITKLRVDGFGRTLEEQRPDGTSTSTELSRIQNNGQWTIKIRTQTPGHQDDTVQLDSMGRVVKSWTQKPQGLNQAVHPRILTVFDYGELGERLIKKSLPVDENTPIQNLHFDEYIYDGMGRLVKHIAPWGAVTGYRYSGRKVEVTAPGGAITLIENDALGRPIHIMDPELGITSYAYGPFQFLTSVLDASGALTVYERDALGRVTALQDPDRGTTVSQYNGFGELTHSEDALGRSVDLHYDSIGRLTSKLDADGLSAWIFDKNRLAEVWSPAGHKVLYSYDAAGRPFKTEKIIDGEAFAIGQSYDAFSRIQSIQYPAGFSLQREYDAYGHLQKIKQGAETLWQLLGADGAGRINYEQFGAEVTTLREYWQEKNRLKHIHSSTANEVLQELEYGYDERLNLVVRQDKLQQESEFFSYDKLDRITHACLSSFWQNIPCPQAYSYDASGNFVFKFGVGSYEYEPTRPHTVSKIGGAEYIHDAVGNLRQSPGALIEYTAFDLPKKASIPGDELSFDYDGHQNRVRKRSLTRETVYFDGLYERVSDSVSGASEHRFYIYSDERLVALHTESNQSGSDTRYIHVDHLGSTDVITDAQGKVIERQSFDAFGAPRNPVWNAGPNMSGPPSLARGFTGHESDSELNLINMRGRLMDPHIGRFITPDPILANPAFSQSFSPFSYVANSPLSAIDPSGFTSEVGVPVAPPVPTEGWPEGWTVTGYAVFAMPDGVDIDTSTLPEFDYENNIADIPVDFGREGVPGGGSPQRSPAETETPGRERSQSGTDIAIDTGIGVAAGVGELLWEAGKFAILNVSTLGAYGCYKFWEGAYAGYQEWGVLGILNPIVPLGTVLSGTEKTLASIADGDYRSAGKVGIQTLIIGIATVITLGEGAAALAGGKGASGAGAIAKAEAQAAKEGAALKPYGGPGGGHHVPAKSAFNGAPGYDPNKALAIPNAELTRLNVNHQHITKAQSIAYRDFAKTGQNLTWESVAKIETSALIKGGMSADMASTTVHNAIDALQSAGVEGPTRIPWGK